METWNAVLLWTGNLFTTVLAIQIFSCTEEDKGKYRLQTFLSFLGWFAFTILLLSLFDHLGAPRSYMWFDTEGLGDAWGPFLNRDRLAAFGELMLPIVLSQALLAKLAGDGWIKRLLPIGMAGGIVAVVIAGASRAGVVVMTCELALMFISVYQSRRRFDWDLRSILGGFIAITILFCALVGPQTVLKRFTEADPYSGRREMLISSLGYDWRAALAWIWVGELRKRLSTVLTFRHRQNRQSCT